jgi:hypothetical protein
MVEAIVAGRQPEGVTLPGLLGPIPAEWIQHMERFVGCRGTET